MVIGGNSSQGLARRIAKKLKAGYVNTSTRTFPDGESKITIKKIPKKKIIVVVQSTFPPVDSNLLQLLSTVSQARKYSSKVYAVIPYLGYARQDREFLGGEVFLIRFGFDITETINVGIGQGRQTFKRITTQDFMAGDLQELMVWRLA